MAIEDKRQNSVERQQVWLTGAQLVVCLLHILRDNYPFSTCLNKRSRFTCSAPGLKWILKIETHGKAIQVASAEHHDQIGKKSVLMCKFTQERFSLLILFHINIGQVHCTTEQSPAHKWPSLMSYSLKKLPFKWWVRWFMNWQWS